MQCPLNCSDQAVHTESERKRDVYDCGLLQAGSSDEVRTQLGKSLRTGFVKRVPTVIPGQRCRSVAAVDRRRHVLSSRSGTFVAWRASSR